MLENVLPDNVFNVINHKVSVRELSEIRIRKDKPIVVFVKGQPYYINQNGLTCNIDEALFANQEMINDIVYRASDYSIYAVNEQLKQGFLMLENGIRIGVVGNIVSENNCIKTITNWSSLNIRIPHSVRNFSLCAFDEIINENGVNNTLIVSPPGAGKTTFIRDIVYQLSKHNYCLNVSIIDERGEISGGVNSGIDLGNFCDVVSYCSKTQGFGMCIRSMNPNLIVTDELGNEDDVKCLINAMNSGVKVIATIHASGIEQLKRKPIFDKLPSCYFQRYVLLSNREGPGTFEGVFNEKFSKILKW